MLFLKNKPVKWDKNGKNKIFFVKWSNLIKSSVCFRSITSRGETFETRWDVLADNEHSAEFLQLICYSRLFAVWYCHARYILLVARAEEHPLPQSLFDVYSEDILKKKLRCFEGKYWFQKHLLLFNGDPSILFKLFYVILLCFIPLLLSFLVIKYATNGKIIFVLHKK